jgi:hypothetical protein
MDFTQLTDLLFSDQSVKFVCVVMAFDMRHKVSRLTNALESLEKCHDKRKASLEIEVIKLKEVKK